MSWWNIFPPLISILNLRDILNWGAWKLPFMASLNMKIIISAKIVTSLHMPVSSYLISQSPKCDIPLSFVSWIVTLSPLTLLTCSCVPQVQHPFLPSSLNDGHN